MKSIRLVLHNKTQPYINNGMDLYRLAMPYSEVIEEQGQLIAMSLDEFDMMPCDADVYVMNRPELFRAKKVKALGKFLIVDVDDYWNLPTWHRLHPGNHAKYIDQLEKQRLNEDQKKELENIKKVNEREKRQAAETIEACRIADVVTCATETLRAQLDKLGIEAHVIKNSIHPNVSMFSTYKQPSDVTRFGWIGGNYRKRDVALMYGGLRALHNDRSERGKYQIVSAFNNNNEYVEIEKILTDGYKNCSPDYIKYLLKYTRVGSHIGGDEPYQRLWNMSPTEYGVMYEQVHVALIPHRHGMFNSCKSELKLIEAGVTGCAAIVSNVLPYAPYLKHGVNCLVTEGEKGWYSAMKRLINRPDEVKMLADNLRQTVLDNFDTRTEANKLKQLIA